MNKKVILISIFFILLSIIALAIFWNFYNDGREAFIYNCVNTSKFTIDRCISYWNWQFSG